MTFQSDLELFYGTEQVKQWSRPGNDTGATTIDTAVIDRLEEITNGKFETLAGVELDLTTDSHVEPAMQYAGALLRSFGSGLGFFGEDVSGAEDAIRNIRFIDHSDTVTPKKANANKIPIGSTNDSAFDSYTLRKNGLPPIRRNPTYYEDDRYT